MVKELKYKAYDKKLKRIVEVISLDFTEWWIQVRLDDSEENYKGYGERHSFKDEETNRFILLESIGLVDRNNIEIYFGDIVIWNKKKYVVIWSMTLLGVELQPLENYRAKKKDPSVKRLTVGFMFGRAIFTEVIGSVHEDQKG